MGVGKSTVGRCLARRLGWPLSDSDEVIGQEQGATVRELGDRLGTDGMHRLESQHLLHALADPHPSVICAAASVVDDPHCRQALERGGLHTVWLQGRAETLAQRFASGPHRPVFDPDAERLFRGQLSRRSQEFAEVARQRVSVEGRTPAEIVQAILACSGGLDSRAESG
jgi:shikimate kinase